MFSMLYKEIRISFTPKIKFCQLTDFEINAQKTAIDTFKLNLFFIPTLLVYTTNSWKAT